MRKIALGTSGWSYPGWEEKFYGQRLSCLNQLSFYAKKFNSVEINYSFYHIPKAETFEKWEKATPKDFVFSVKLNRQFTHIQQLMLTGQSLAKLKTFLQNAGGLGEKFSVLLIQTPGSLKFNPALLESFLNSITAIFNGLNFVPRLAFEFRHQSWFNGQIYSLLKSYRAAMVIGQSSRHPQIRAVLSDLIYIRLHGPDKMFDSSYTHEQLQEWRDFINQHPQADVYVYFNNTMGGQAIDNALYLQELFMV